MKYKVGERVKVKHPYSGNGFEHGELVTIVRFGCEDGYEKNCYGAVSENDETVWYLYEDEVESCLMTNADRIRAMSDEELVVFLDGFSGRCLDCAEDAKNKRCPIYKEGHFCRPKDIMEWLQQPAEEDDHA